MVLQQHEERFNGCKTEAEACQGCQSGTQAREVEIGETGGCESRPRGEAGGSSAREEGTSSREVCDNAAGAQGPGGAREGSNSATSGGEACRARQGDSASPSSIASGIGQECCQGSGRRARQRCQQAPATFLHPAFPHG